MWFIMLAFILVACGVDGGPDSLSAVESNYANPGYAEGGDSQSQESDTDTDADSDTDSDADADADTDTDADADTDTDSDTDTDTGPVECTIDIDGDGQFSVDDPCGSGTDEDDDDDGYLAESAGGTDCNDGYEFSYPGATVWCNEGEDLDCDGVNDADEAECVDDVETDDCTIDEDGDGYYSVDDPCGTGMDCTDWSSGVHPGATEVCDYLDNDCDGDVDEGMNTTTVWWDDDDDGYGSDEYYAPLEACESADELNHWADNADDCDDNDSDVNPGAVELCDGTDQNCTAGIDDEIEECWDAVYRFQSPTSETRCWGFGSTDVPWYCADLHTGGDYQYEQEAFIIAAQQFDGNVELWSCQIGSFEEYWFDQVLTVSTGDKATLESDGYLCESVGYVWELGDGPDYNPFARECDVERYVWDDGAGVGNGHIFTIMDNTSDMIWEDTVFTIVTDQTCW